MALLDVFCVVDELVPYIPSKAADTCKKKHVLSADIPTRHRKKRGGQVGTEDN